MFGRTVPLVAAGILTVAGPHFAEAKTQTIRTAQATVPGGEKATLQDLYAWDEKCRALNVNFRPGMSANGKLYTVRDKFRVKGVPEDPCNGKIVSGKRVVFEAKPGFKGKTTISYSVKMPNYPDTFIFMRPIRVR